MAKFKAGDQVWYIDRGRFCELPTVHSGMIESVLINGRLYGFGKMVVKDAADVFDNPESARAKVPELIREKIERVHVWYREKISEFNRVLEREEGK